MDRRPRLSPVRIALGLLVALPAAGALVAVGMLGVLYARAMPGCTGVTCPAVDDLGAYHPPEPPRILDRHGHAVAQLSGPRRVTVRLGSLPPLLRRGFVAVEDRRFFQHGGIDLQGGLRAAWRNLRAGGVEEGASTLTMQLARNIYGDLLGYNRWRRKLAEVRLARAIEHALGKEEILELYLNQIYLGDGVYGVATGARHYFGKDPVELSPLETALLIGLAKNPEGYNPRRDLARAERRARTVLGVLGGEGLLGPAELEAARHDSLRLAPPPAPGWGDDGYSVMAVRRELVALYPDPLDRRGLQVHTTLDTAVQHAAARALRRQIRAVEAGRFGRYRHPVPEDSLPRAEGASPWLQGMVVAMDPGTGALRAVVGGRDFDHSEFDRAMLGRRQPGSAFKPVVWATALDAGYQLHSRVSTEPVRFARVGEEDWTPRDHVELGTLSLREGLVRSSNTVAARLGQAVGAPAVQQHARAMGITTPLTPWPSLFLGASEVSPVELVAAYATFANGGHRVAPYLIESIRERDGTTRHVHTPDQRRALSPEVAYLVLDALRDVVDSGTGRAVRAAGLEGPVAGKTGTTDESRDVWFVGLTPEIAAGVWLGFDRPAPILPGAEGGTLAAPAWAAFVKAAGLEGRGEWPRPEGLEEVRVDTATGEALPPACGPDDAPVALVRSRNATFRDCGRRIPTWLGGENGNEVLEPRLDRRGPPVDEGWEGEWVDSTEGPPRLPPIRRGLIPPPASGAAADTVGTTNGSTPRR